MSCLTGRRLRDGGNRAWRLPAVPTVNQVWGIPLGVILPLPFQLSAGAPPRKILGVQLHTHGAQTTEISVSGAGEYVTVYTRPTGRLTGSPWILVPIPE